MPHADISPSIFDDDLPLDPLQAAMQLRDADILQVVRESLAAGNSRLAFQPVVAASDHRRVAFHEGLIRVLDQAGRIIPAGQFMNRIEDTELGREVDCASLALGLDMLRRTPGLRLAVNMSARSMADGKWRDTLVRGLHAAPEIGPRLILEISEDSAMQLAEVLIRFMAEMQPRGVSFALDDFGAGLISFRALKDFFFDLVKIDSIFVRGIDQNPDNQVMTESLITIARQFEMFSVAEGVETSEEKQILVAMGVDCLQGYHFGVPRFEL